MEEGKLFLSMQSIFQFNNFVFGVQNYTSVIWKPKSLWKRKYTATSSNIYENNLDELHVNYLGGCILGCNQLPALSTEPSNVVNGFILWPIILSVLPSLLHVFSSSVKLLVGSTLHVLQWVCPTECLVNCFRFLFYNNLVSFMQLPGTLFYFFVLLQEE